MCSIITSFTAAGVLQHMPLAGGCYKQLKPDSQNWFGLQRLNCEPSCGLHSEGWQACLHTACWAVRNEQGIWLHSPLFICWTRISRKKRKYISSSLSINFPCNYIWLKSTAKEGTGNREIGLSLENQLNYVQCGARSYIKKAILQGVQQAMRQIRIWVLITQGKMNVFSDILCFQNQGTKPIMNAISASHCSTSGFKAALVTPHVFFHLYR